MLKLTRKYFFPQGIIIFRSYKSDTVRVRFAPSPTGFLHLGGLRTALYNFLFARKYNGKFILRIEDTDQSRLVPGAIEELHRELKWSGIEIDEGPVEGGNFGPYLQSQRLQFYRENVEILLENGSAYHCFCTENRLQLVRKAALRAQEIPKYDNRCRHLTSEEVHNRLDRGEKSCIRFKINDEEESFDDLIYGKISYNISLNEGDPVILKSDGFPTYHFANVVDDHLMKITHVLRGVEWQISTTKHILLYQAFNWKPPVFGHLPLLMNTDGTKLSKRQGDFHINYYRENNIFPLALINFIVHSGGGFAKDLESHLKPKCYTLDQLTEQFDVSRINTHSGKLMPERLLEFNKLEIRRMLENDNDRKNMILLVSAMLKETFPDRALNKTLHLDEEYISNILHWALPRISKLSDLISNKMKFLWLLPTGFEINGKEIDNIRLIKELIENEEDLTVDQLNISFKNICREHSIKYSSFMKLMRLVLSGLRDGPSVAEMIVILGKKNSLERIDLCINNTIIKR